VWTMFWTIWLCQNGELYGKHYKEKWSIALWTTHDRVWAIYERTKDSNNPNSQTAPGTNQGSLEVDKMSPRCIPSNGQSVPWTKHWPRLTLQDSLVTTWVVAIMRRCMAWQHCVYINQHL
jgi:hypothetical protein